MGWNLTKRVSTGIGFSAIVAAYIMQSNQPQAPVTNNPPRPLQVATPVTNRSQDLGELADSTISAPQVHTRPNLSYILTALLDINGEQFMFNYDRVHIGVYADSAENLETHFYEFFHDINSSLFHPYRGLNREKPLKIKIRIGDRIETYIDVPDENGYYDGFVDFYELTDHPIYELKKRVIELNPRDRVAIQRNFEHGLNVLINAVRARTNSFVRRN